ncbi:protein ABHD11 isoform X2 [Scyliorhinus canicula]|uniref:protein ABHD11 isoform X2 n=1 Tax=Scyliorhinus canicula TaxID=7830 RepID=UPI0018F5BD48|nr:protein ABHD11 isoform X2 [Scyliorhinus canicula]
MLLRSWRWVGALGVRLPIPAPLRGAGRTSAGKPVDLAYDVIDGRNTETPLICLHGLFGSRSNFYSVAKALSQRTGRMPELIERLVVVDVTPSQTFSHTDFPKFITAMRAVTVDGDLTRSAARNQVEQQLQPYIEDIRIRQFLLTNLVERDGQYVWRVNLEAVANHMDYILTFPKFNTPYTAPTVFLGGGNSPYISSKDYPEIKRLFPNSVIQHVPGTGHWVHAEKPHDFINAICTFLGTS